MADDNEQQAGGQQAITGQLAIQKIYVKDVSFEAPNSPAIFTGEMNPTADVHFANRTQALDAENHEVVLTVTVKVHQGERTVYLVEVQQAGIFRVAGVPEEALRPFLASAVPNILFPYAREAVSDATVRAGFPPVVLQPVNFDAMAQVPQGEAAETAATIQ